jgi:hypothetical protein
MPGEYLFTAASVCLPPAPSIARNAEVYCFAFPADAAKCQAFVNAGHNRAGRPDQFRAFMSHVFFTMVKTPDLTAADPEFAGQGTMAETDIGFWLLVGEYDHGAIFPKHLFWMPTYLFVDNAYAMTSGREIWGFPKYFATMTLPEARHANGPFEVSALAFRRHGPGMVACPERVLSLTCNEPAHDAAPRGILDTITHLCNASGVALIDEVLRRLRAPFAGGDAGLAVPVLYLKQFRSANSPTEACYRELLTGPLTLTTLRETRLLTGPWQLELQDLASLPFIEDLGLGTPVDGKLILSTGAGVWADVDFELGPASPI